MNMTTSAMPNFTNWLKEQEISIGRLAVSMNMDSHDLCKSIRKGRMNRQTINDLIIILKDAGYELPDGLWINKEGVDLSLPPRTLLRLNNPKQKIEIGKSKELPLLEIIKENNVEPLSLTARERFGLNYDPFRAEIHEVSDLHITKEHELFRKEIIRAAIRGDFICVTGEVGAGKTTVMEAALMTMPANVHIIKCHTLDKTELTGNNLYDAIILDLTGAVLNAKGSIPSQREKKARYVIDLLRALAKEQKIACLILDEAHALNNECLRALKRLRELESGFQQLISIILIAQLEIMPRLKNPTIREVSQRCAVNIMRGLGKDTGPYIAHKIQKAGGKFDKIFTPDAVEEILRICQRKDGRVLLGPYPLEINMLCTLAMNYADNMDENVITRDLIDQINPKGGA